MRACFGGEKKWGGVVTEFDLLDLTTWEDVSGR